MDEFNSLSAPQRVIAAVGGGAAGYPDAPLACGPRFAASAGDPMVDNDCRGGLSIKSMPEALLGSHCPTDNPNTRDKSRLVPGISANIAYPAMSIQSIDYSTVGPVGQVRAAIKALSALATFNVASIVGVVAGALCTVTTVAAAPHSVGIYLAWGTGLTAYAPFETSIDTSGWVNPFGAGSLDRHVVVRLQNVNGGEIFLPLAQRVVPGMTMAQVQVGTAPVGSTIIASGLPAAVAASFSLIARFLTPFTPLTSQWARGNGIFDCRGDSC